MHKILKEFKIQTDHLIPTRQPDLSDSQKKKKKKKRKEKKRKKRTCRIVDLSVSVDHWVKLKKTEKRGNYLDHGEGIEKPMEHEGDNDTNCN